MTVLGLCGGERGRWRCADRAEDRYSKDELDVATASSLRGNPCKNVFTLEAGVICSDSHRTGNHVSQEESHGPSPAL